MITLDDIITMTRQGWTRDEILALSEADAKRQAPAPQPEPTPAPQPEPAPAPQPAPAPAPQPAPQMDDRIVQALERLNGAIDLMQSINRTSDQLPKPETSEDIFANIIAPRARERS